MFKSETLKPYLALFQPTGPYLRLSKTTPWKKQIPKKRNFFYKRKKNILVHIYILVNHLTINQSFKLLLEPLMPICQLVILVISNGFGVISNQQIGSEALWRLDGDLQRKKHLHLVEEFWYLRFCSLILCHIEYFYNRKGSSTEQFLLWEKMLYHYHGIPTFITLFLANFFLAQCKIKLLTKILRLHLKL